jgi:hypothetical protein
MKYLITLLVGMVFGVVVFVLLLYYNPFAATPSVSPLAVSELDLANFSYSLVVRDSIAFTNDGESRIRPYPAKVLQLWEPAVKKTRALVTVLTDSRGQPAGLGVKFSSDSETTRLINAEALVDSVWHIYSPEHGTFFVDQTENFWPYLHDIVVPARLSGGDSWRGSWYRITSVGPGALGIARVTGGSGVFADTEAEAVESITASAYSAITGPVAMTGNLTIALPRQEEQP